MTEWLGLNEICIKAFEDIYSKEQQSATIRQGIMRLLAWYEEILQEKKSLRRQTSVLDSFKSSSGTLASSPVLLNIGDDDPVKPPTVPEEGPQP
jgi:hypothetical protein